MNNLRKGLPVDLDMLTDSERTICIKNPKMIHFNKVLTKINAILCDMYSKRFSDNAECSMQ
jgi:hypothetical protein